MSYARQLLNTDPRTFNVAIDALDDRAQACSK